VKLVLRRYNSGGRERMTFLSPSPDLSV
jgi:hypothetical protein